jgi:hypothetical protein
MALRAFRPVSIQQMEPFEFAFGGGTAAGTQQFGGAGSPAPQQPNCSWGSQFGRSSPRSSPRSRSRRRPGTSGGLGSPRITAQNPYGDNRPNTVGSPRGGGRGGGRNGSPYVVGASPWEDLSLGSPSTVGTPLRYGSPTGSASPGGSIRGGSSSPRLESPRSGGSLSSPKQRLWHGGSGIGVNGTNNHGYDPQTGSPVSSRLEFPHRDVLPQHNDYHYTMRLQSTLPAVGVRAGSVHPLHPNHPGAASEAAGASSPLTRAGFAAAAMGGAGVQGTPTAKRSPRPPSQDDVSSQEQRSPKPSLYYRSGYQGHEFISIG